MAAASCADDESKGHGASTLAFTEGVLRLQRDLHAAEPDEKLAALAACMGRLRELTDRKDREARAEQGLVVWKQLASMDLTAYGLEFPPPFVTTMVKEVLARQLSAACCNAPGSGCGTVLHGPVGVGKSTLLRVLCALHALYRPDVIVVFWEYENFSVTDGALPPGPHQLVHAVAKWADGDRSAPLIPPAFRKVARGSLPMLSPCGTKRLYGLFFDEVNVFYTSAEDGSRYEGAQLDWGTYCVRSLTVLGKDTRAVVTCAGSGLQVPAMVYATGQRDERVYRQYNSVNRTVYTLKGLLPLRSADLVKAFVLSRYGVTIEDAEAARLFHATGGVTRRIHHWATHGRDTEAQYQAALAEARSALTNTAKPAVQAAFAAFAGMWYARGGFEDGAGKEESKRESFRTGDSFTQRRPKDLPAAAVTLLQCNAMVVIINCHYEFLVPATADAIVSYFEDDMEARQLLAFKAVIREWDPTRSAGAVCVEPILKHAIEHTSRWYTLAVDGGTLYLGDTPAASCDLRQMDGAVLRVHKETGADAFVLRVGNAGVIGVEAYHVQLDGQWQRRLPDNFYRDTHILARVIAKLEVAWRWLKGQLEAACLGTEFRLTKAFWVSNMPRSTLSGAVTSCFEVEHTQLSVDCAPVPLQQVIGERFWAMLPADWRDVEPSHAKPT